jgi:hypothetical protein
MNPTRTETARLLRRAAAHVRETGLHKGTYFPFLSDRPDTDAFPFAPACTVGHLMVAAGTWQDHLGWRDIRVQSAIWEMGRQLFPSITYQGDAFDRVTTWNDDFQRTADEVADLMEATAARLDPVPADS